MSIIGVDIGYGFTKSYYHSSSSNSTGYDIFPTVISKFIPKTTFGEKMTLIKVNGEEFSLAESALREGSGLIDTKRGDFVGSSPYFAVLALSISRTINNPQVLVLGLPPGQYSKEHVGSLIEKLRDISLMIPTESAEWTRLVLPKTIKFIPQGAGIFFSHIQKGNKSDYNKNLAVLDIGYYTLDMLFFAKGKYVEKTARSYPFGVFEIYEEIKKTFYQKHQIFLKSDKSVDNILSGKGIEVAGVSYSLDVSEILNAYTTQISSVIEGYIEKLPDDPEIVIAGGGGIKLLPSAPLKYNLKVVPESQLANAKGFYEYGTFL